MIDTNKSVTLQIWQILKTGENYFVKSVIFIWIMDYLYVQESDRTITTNDPSKVCGSVFYDVMINIAK